MQIYTFPNNSRNSWVVPGEGSEPGLDWSILIPAHGHMRIVWPAYTKDIFILKVLFSLIQEMMVFLLHPVVMAYH